MIVFYIKIKVFCTHAVKEYVRVEAWLHSFLTLELGGGEWSASQTLAAFPL
jgi:hypothetical protein